MDLKDFFEQKMNKSMELLKQMGMNEEQMADFQDVMAMMGESIEPVDIAEELAAYSPCVSDAADGVFLQEMGTWLRGVIAEIPETDVCKMSICYHAAYDEAMNGFGDLWFAYTTKRHEDEEDMGIDSPWNFVNWKEHYIGGFPAEVMAKWLQAKGLDPEEASDAVFDLAVLAVEQLHEEGVTEAKFGKKLPIIMTDYDWYHTTAVRAAKANGTELLDEEFYLECGCDPMR